MKPDSTPPGVPFNFDAIPVWLKPDLWDETKTVRCRGGLFIVLYTLSVAALAAIIAVPVGVYKGADMAETTFLLWLALSLTFGPLMGLGVWWDFVRGSRRISAETASAEEAKQSTDIPEDGKD